MGYIRTDTGGGRVKMGSKTWCWLVGLALAAGGFPTPQAAASGCDADTASRLEFPEERLDASKKHGTYWQRGWLGFYGLGTVVQSINASVEDDGGDQAAYIVSAVKALFGTARLAFVPTQADAAVVRLPVVPGRLLYPLVRILRLSAGLIARGGRRR